MGEVTEGYVDAQTGRVKAEAEIAIRDALLRLIESQRQSDRARFRETIWLAGLIFAAAGVVVAVILAST